MSVTIKGKRNLDANDYERMVIRHQGEDYQAIIKGKTKYKKLTTRSKISEELKGKTDDEKLLMLVKYFLDYSKISFVRDEEIYPYYDGRFSIAAGSRKIDLQISKKCKYNLPKMVLKKYINDRLDFVNDMSSVSNYEILVNSTYSSYEIKDEDIEPCIRFNLIAKEGILFDFEREFLRNFIGGILENSTEEASVERKRKEAPNSRIYLENESYFYCGNVTVKLFKNADMISEVKSMVYKHNLIIHKEKAKQLKLEGF